MAVDDTGLEILMPDECLRLLAGHAPNVGRVGLIHDGRPLVLPVNYAMLDDAVVFRTDRGAKLTAAEQAAAVVFEVDEIDSSWEEGWSVVVHGYAELLQSDEQGRPLKDLGLCSWVPADRAHHVRVVAERVTGRSIEAGRRRRNDVPAWDLHGGRRRDSS